MSQEEVEARRRSSVFREISGKAAAFNINWTLVFKASFMILFVGYPGISLKIFRLFRCVTVEGGFAIPSLPCVRCHS